MLKVFYAIQKEIAILGNYINQLNNVNQVREKEFFYFKPFFKISINLKKKSTIKNY